MIGGLFCSQALVVILEDWVGVGAVTLIWEVIPLFILPRPQPFKRRAGAHFGSFSSVRIRRSQWFPEIITFVVFVNALQKFRIRRLFVRSHVIFIPFEMIVLLFTSIFFVIGLTFCVVSCEYLPVYFSIRLKSGIPTAMPFLSIHSGLWLLLQLQEARLYQLLQLAVIILLTGFHGLVWLLFEWIFKLFALIILSIILHQKNWPRLLESKAGSTSRQPLAVLLLLLITDTLN